MRRLIAILLSAVGLCAWSGTLSGGRWDNLRAALQIINFSGDYRPEYDSVMTEAAVTVPEIAPVHRILRENRHEFPDSIVSALNNSLLTLLLTTSDAPADLCAEIALDCAANAANSLDFEELDRCEEIFHNALQSPSVAAGDRPYWELLYKAIVPSFNFNLNDESYMVNVTRLRDAVINGTITNPHLQLRVGSTAITAYGLFTPKEQTDYNKKIAAAADRAIALPSVREAYMSALDVYRNVALLAVNPKSPIYTMRLRREADRPGCPLSTRRVLLENLLFYDAAADPVSPAQAAALIGEINELTDSMRSISGPSADQGELYYLKLYIDLASAKDVFPGIKETKEEILDRFCADNRQNIRFGTRAIHIFCTGNLLRSASVTPEERQKMIADAYSEIDSDPSAHFNAVVRLNMAGALYGYGQFDNAGFVLDEIPYDRMPQRLRERIEAEAAALRGMSLGNAQQWEEAYPDLRKAMEYYGRTHEYGFCIPLQASIVLARYNLGHKPGEIAAEAEAYGRLRPNFPVPQWQYPFDYYVEMFQAMGLPQEEKLKKLRSLKETAIRNQSPMAGQIALMIAQNLRPGTDNKEIRSNLDYAAPIFMSAILSDESLIFFRNYLQYLYFQGDIDAYNRVLHTIIDRVTGTPAEYSLSYINILSDATNLAASSADWTSTNYLMPVLLNANNRAMNNASLDIRGTAQVELASGSALNHMAVAMLQYSKNNPAFTPPEWCLQFIGSTTGKLDANADLFEQHFPYSPGFHDYLYTAFFLLSEQGLHERADAMADRLSRLFPDTDMGEIRFNQALIAGDYEKMAEICLERFEKARAQVQNGNGYNFNGLNSLIDPLYEAYMHLGRYGEIMDIARWRFGQSRKFVESNYMTMMESQRAAMAANGTLTAADIHATLPHVNTPETRRLAYDGALFFKNLLLQSSTGFRNAVYASADTAAIAAYAEIISLTGRINDLSSVRNDPLKAYDPQAVQAASEEILDLQHRININEILIRDLVPEASRMADRRNTGWHDVQKRLRDDEAAIEFIMTRDSYGALLLRHKGMKAPEFIPLISVSKLNGIMASLESGRLQQAVKRVYLDGPAKAKFYGKELYDSVWAPLEPYLAGVSRIYYSPAGELSGLAFHALEDSTHTALCDRYDLRPVSSTAAVTHTRRRSGADISSLLIFGDVIYDSDSVARSRNWHRLRGSIIEVNTVDSIMRAGGIPTEKRLRLDASEQSFNSLSGNSPECLLMSTHGFFCTQRQTQTPAYRNFLVNKGLLPDAPDAATPEISPMKRAGLILADANPAWNNTATRPDSSDGILTAEEIARLDLSSTRLAVLSACETARGEASLTEGVTGLQRALKLAGVESIVMTLWEVNDNTARMFMTEFFSRLAAGDERHDAFNGARAAVKARYPREPFHWAPFIMLD